MNGQPKKYMLPKPSVLPGRGGFCSSDYRLTRFLSFLFVTAFAVCLSATGVPAGQRAIMGDTKAEVDSVLSGWSSRLSNRATEARPIYYYEKDVEMIVSFSNGKAVGVAVTDRPDAGVSPIPESRYRELIALIGGGEPRPGDIVRDGSSIREFSVGEAD